jgi:hypothetical protein
MGVLLQVGANQIWIQSFQASTSGTFMKHVGQQLFSGQTAQTSLPSSHWSFYQARCQGWPRQFAFNPVSTPVPDQVSECSLDISSVDLLKTRVQQGDGALRSRSVDLFNVSLVRAMLDQSQEHGCAYRPRNRYFLWSPWFVERDCCFARPVNDILHTRHTEPHFPSC